MKNNSFSVFGKLTCRVTLVVLGMTIFPKHGMALVDYSEEPETSSVKPKSSGGGVMSSLSSSGGATVSRASVSSSSSSGAGRPMLFSLSPSYEVFSVEQTDKESKVNATRLNAKIYSPWNFQLDLRYAMYDSKDKDINPNGKGQKGNLETRVAVDWLSFGGESDRTALTFVGGASFKSGNSSMGNSRNDKIVGLETSKRFYWFGLGLGYELTLTGSPKNQDEKEIGNINHLYAGLDFDLSNQINVALMADNYSITATSGSRENRLEEKVSFNTLTASLNLRPGAFLVELGARYNTKKAANPGELVDARLWNLAGAYGNSIFTSLGLSF